MLKVQRYSSITSPGDGFGTSRQVMPFASPSFPLVRQKVAQCVATCIPVVHIFSPLIHQPSTTSLVWRKTGRASCRDRAVPYGLISGVVGTLKKKKIDRE